MIDVNKLLVKLTESELEDYDDLETQDVEAELIGEYDDVDEIEDDLEYTEEMVHVFKKNDDSYLVESDMLAKYMRSNHITSIKEAMDNIAQHNQISEASMVLVIESKDYVSNIISEAKACKGSEDCKKKLSEGSSTAKFLKKAKADGVKLACRK